MRVSLRIKVFLPLLILMTLLVGYLYLSWMPRSLANMERQWEDATKRHLDSVVEGVIPLLLGRELDTIYENFNALLKKNRDWTGIRLTDAEGRPLYPIQNKPLQDSSTPGRYMRTLTKQISYLDMNLGKLTVTVDFSSHLTEWKREFYTMVSIMLAVIAATVLSVGIILERKVVQPVKSLELAAQKVAEGKFDGLHLRAGDDEVGHLVDSFSVMRENLALSYSLLRQSRDKYSTLYNETPVLLHTVDEAGIIVEVNDFWLRKLGYQRDDVLGRKATDFMTEASRKYAVEVVLPVFLHCGFCKDVPYQFVKKNGELEDVLLSATAERDEKGSIVRCFTVIEDVTDRKKIENKLILSEQTNRIITSTAKDAIIMIDDGDCVLFWNPAAENIFGYTREEMLGKAMHETLAPESFREKYVKGMETFRDSGKGGAIGHTMEVTAKRKDGTEFPIALSLSSFQLNDRWHAVGIARDITQRKLAEKNVLASLEEKELLLQEIHHRVKNNLQIISSLLDLQLEYVAGRNPREIFSEIKNRVKSMAFVHEKLYLSKNLSRIDFNDYLTTLIGNLYRSYNVSPSKIALKLDVEDVFLGIDTAIPCGLVINELITNALKYAFPADRNGEVHVRLRMAGLDEKEERLYELIVEDDGVGLPQGVDMGGANTLGLYLVTTLVEHQLRGSIEVKRENGTKFFMRLKELKYKGRI